MLERSRLKSQARHYDCDHCLARGLIESMNRSCYLQANVLQTEQLTPDLKGGSWKRSEKLLVNLTADETIEVASEVYADWPTNAPFYSVYINLFPQVCPTSIISPDVEFWISVEGQVKDYGVLPHVGGLMDQPSKLLAILSTIRSTKNEWNAVNGPLKDGGD